MSRKGLTRREFLRAAGLSGVGLVAAACAPSLAPTTAPPAGPTTAPVAAGTPATGPRPGGVLKISDSGLSSNNLGYPPTLTGPQNIRQAAPAIETLLRYDKSLKATPWLATDFATDAANKTISLTLRKGVKFHDGTDFNAAAAKWNLEACMTAKMAAAQRLKSVDAVDDSTVRINLSEWDSTVINSLCSTMGMMISPTAVQKNGSDWAVTHPVGTGPFKFVSWEKDVNIKHKKFDGYWQKDKPYLDAIEFPYISDLVTRFMSLKGRDVDAIVTIQSELRSVADMEKEGFVVYRVKLGSGAVGLLPSSANTSSPWTNLKVRQAAQHAIDPDPIVKAVMGIEGEVTNQYIYKGHWGYNPEVVGYPYDPAKAKQLLAEAGYPNGFKTKLIYASIYAQVVTAAQGYLKAVNIDAELVPMEQGGFNQLTYQGGSWDGLVYLGPSGDPDFISILNTRMSGKGGFYNSSLWPDDYKQAIQNAITAPDFAGQQKWVHEAMKLMVDKYAMPIMLYAYNDLAVARPFIRDSELVSTSFGGKWTPENVWLDTNRT